MLGIHEHVHQIPQRWCRNPSLNVAIPKPANEMSTNEVKDMCVWNERFQVPYPERLKKEILFGRCVGDALKFGVSAPGSLRLLRGSCSFGSSR